MARNPDYLKFLQYKQKQNGTIEEWVCKECGDVFDSNEIEDYEGSKLCKSCINENISVLPLLGEEYEFNVYRFGARFNCTGGVYLLTKREINKEKKVNHTLVLIGETADLSDLKHLDNYKKVANCIGIYEEEDKDARRQIRDELAAYYKLY